MFRQGDVVAVVGTFMSIDRISSGASMRLDLAQGRASTRRTQRCALVAEGGR
ncbi:MAG: hypothetical protein H6722_18845 [Sandaracinus sp.]|nr:hypothetical protein [Sandaracinus sp.]